MIWSLTAAKHMLVKRLIRFSNLWSEDCNVWFSFWWTLDISTRDWIGGFFLQIHSFVNFLSPLWRFSNISICWLLSCKVDGLRFLRRTLTEIKCCLLTFRSLEEYFKNQLRTVFNIWFIWNIIVFVAKWISKIFCWNG